MDRSLIALGSATVFEAEDEDTYIELNIQNAAALDGATVWDEEKTIAENSVTTEEILKKLWEKMHRSQNFKIM